MNHIVCNDTQLASSYNVRIVLLCAEWVPNRMSVPVVGCLFLLGGRVILVLIARATLVQVNIYCDFSRKNVWLDLWLRVALFMSSTHDWVLDGSMYC